MGARGFRQLDWYETPRYYDIVFDEDTEPESDFLETMLERHGPRPRKGAPRRILEPACGSGRLVLSMARRGYAVTGFDASGAMLDYCRERLGAAGLGASLLEARMEDFRFRGKFDLAHCGVSTFKYLLRESDARSHLQCVARSLRKGGLYVLSFHLTDYASTKQSRERWDARREGTRVVCNIQGWPADRKKRLEDVRSRLVVHEDGRELRSETLWKFRTYDAAQAKRLIRSVPEFELVAVHDFWYEADFEITLDDTREDVVLVLRKA